MTHVQLYDLRVTVERIEGRSVCGLEVGDYFEVTEYRAASGFRNGYGGSPDVPVTGRLSRSPGFRGRR